MDNIKSFQQYLSESDDYTIYTNTKGGSFWGNRGAGILPIAKSTGRIMVILRSSYVNEPGTWGTIGGKIDDHETLPKTAAAREFEEETQQNPRDLLQVLPLAVYKSPDGTFEYHNFAGVVQDEFVPVLNWESEDYKWITYDELLKLDNKHFGLDYLIKNSKSQIRSLTKS